MIPAAVTAAGVLGAVAGGCGVHAVGTARWTARAPEVAAPVAAGGVPAAPDRAAAVDSSGEPLTGRALRAAVLGGALVTVGLVVATVLALGAAAALPAFLLLAAAAAPLAVVDLRHHLLPDRLVLPLLGAGAALLLLAAALDGTWTPALRAGAAAGVLFAVFLVLALVAPAGLGMGDVKLAAVVGLFLGWLGWGPVLLGAVGGFVVQAGVALALLASRRIGLRGELPFGPAMLAGAFLALWAAHAA